MSTYTDYKCERKENITILRKPNCPEFDGFTPQKVIFGNEANIFKGTFQGKVIAQDMALSGVEITDCTINGGVLLDTSLCSDGEIIKLSDLTSQVSQFGTDLYSTLCSRVSGLESNFSSSQTNISGQLSVLSTEIIRYTNKLIETSCEYISTELTTSINNISTELTTSITKVSTELTNIISSVSTELTTSINNISTEITSNINTISIDLSNEIIYRVSSDTYISSNLSTLSNEFIYHVEQNKEDFEYLTKYMLSTVEHDKHYQFYYSNNIISSVPYKLHNFGINIIQDSVNNVKLRCDNIEIGYATKFTDTHDKQYINIYIDSRNFNKFDEILPDEYNETLKLNDPPKKIQYGSELYTIEYSNRTGTELIYIQSNASNYIKLYNINNEWIGSIINYELESGTPSLKILSGQLQLRYNPNAEIFNEFYDIFKSIEFNIYDKRCHRLDEFRISFNYDDQEFTFEKYVQAERFIHVINNDTSLNNAAELGIIYEKDCNIVENEIQSFTFNGIKQFGKATLIKENDYFDFSTISNYIIKFDNTNNTINISLANTYYEYEFSSSDHNIYGSLRPLDGKQLLNTDSNISVTISAKIPSGDDIIVVPNTYELIKNDDRWIYEAENNTIQYADGQLLIKGNLGNISYTTDDGVYSIDVYNGKHKYSDTELVATSRRIDFNFNNGDTEYISPDEYRYTSSIDDEITYVTVNNNLPNITISDISEDDQYVQYEIPTLDNKYNDCSREFIIASNIKSNGNVKIKFFDVNKQQITNISSNTEVGILTQPANKLVVMKVNEVEPNGFFVTYITHDHLFANISKLSSDLSTEISNRISLDEYLSVEFDNKLLDEISTRIKIDNELSAAISSNITSINDIIKNMRGGLNYQDTLCIDIKYSDDTPINTISSLIYENISRKTNNITDIQIESLRLREGFFYVLVADKKTDRRILDGHELEYGDWLIIKNNTILSNLTSADVNIFDAQDYDSFRLSNDNIATGNNIFTGEISITNTAFIKHISSLTGYIDDLSVMQNTVLSSNIDNIFANNATIKNGNISNLTALNSDLSNASISNLTANNISVENIDAISAGISNLTTTNTNTANAIISDITATNTIISNASIYSLTANIISVENIDIVSAGISNLTANVISSENIDIVSAEISNLTVTDVNINTGTITNAQIAKLSATDAELINTIASTISVDFEKLINTNAQTSSSYPNALSLINKIELSVDGISSIVANEISNTVRYFGNLSTAYSQNTLTGFLHNNFNETDTFQFRKGFQYHITDTYTLSANNVVKVLNENDYIIFNSDVVLSNVTWDNIDIIRDAEAECKSLSNLVFNLSSELSTLSGELCSNILYLSNQISSNNNNTTEGIQSLAEKIDSLSDSISSNYALISTIPLSTSQLINNGIDNGAFLLSNNVTISAINNDGTEYIKLYINHKEFASLNANNFTKDGMLQNVKLVGTNADAELILTWNVDGSEDGNTVKEISLPLSNLINNLYNGYNGINVDDFKIGADFGIIAQTSDLTSLSSKVNTLSDNTLKQFEQMSSDVSSVLYNVASYHGHIRINKDTSVSSLYQIFHSNNLIQDGHIKNGTIIDIEILSGDKSNGDASFNKELTYTTSDGFTFHNKDFIIIHDQSRHTMYIDANNISNNNVKIITAVDWPLFYSLCCTVSSDYLWLKGGNTSDNNHAISGDNDFINGLNRFEQLSAAKLSANNVDLISGIILNLTANIISSENVDSVSAGISNLTALSSNLSDVGISNLNVNNLSIDLNKLINTNLSSRDNYPSVQTFVTSVELSIGNLSTTLGNKIAIDGKMLGTETLSINHISQDDYHKLVLNKEEGPLSNTLYIVSSDALNMYGEAIQNLADPISATDAVNKQYVDSISTYLSNDYEQKLNSNSESFNNKLNAISNIVNNKITIDGISSDSVDIKHIAQEEYHELVANNNVLSNTLYIVSSNALNMYGERITNLAAPLSATDATNKAYVDNIQNDIKTKILNFDTLSTIYEYGNRNRFDEIDCGQIVSALYELICVFCN